MLHLSFNIRNYIYKLNNHCFYLDKNWHIYKTKFLEFDIYIADYYLLNLLLDIDFKHDHGGITLSICLFGVSITIRFYDCRHYDYENHKWIDY